MPLQRLQPVLCDENHCTSCMACLNACKYGAISFIEASWGTLVPKINDYKCVLCYLCNKTCPVLNIDKSIFRNPIQTYAGYTKNDVDRLTCSSGGAVTAISRFVLNKNGCVFGVSFDNTGRPVFMGSDEVNQIDSFKGSKYVFSDPGLIYQKVETKLRYGQLCLFTGTPCQVDGLLHFLKQPYENLLTVDLVCHGTPSFQTLKQHIEQNGIPAFDHVSFRGEYDYSIRIKKNQKLLYSKKQEEDEYFKSFIDNLIHRECCYSCNYAQQKRISDITCSDFWGLSKDALGGYKGKVSCMLLNTQKAIMLFDQLKGYFIYELRPLEEAVKGNDQLRHPSIKNEERKDLLILYPTYGFRKSIHKLNIYKKIKKNRIRNKILYIPRLIKHCIYK